MTLTAAECRIAAERAKKYPPTYGHSYLAIELTQPLIEDVCGRALPTGANLGNNNFVAALLEKHPEYIEQG